MFDFDLPINRTYSLKHDAETLHKMYGQSNIIPMWVADMDFAVMPQVTEALTNQAQQATMGYLPPNSLNLQFINWYLSQHNVNIQTNWAHQAQTLVQSFHLLLENFTPAESAVIILSPVYMEFAKSISQTYRTMVHNNLKYANGAYSIDFDELERLASFNNTHALIFCNPHNPVGRVWTSKELEQVVQICIKHQIFLISDEVHADIVFSPNKFTSMLAFKEIHNQLAVCYSPAKTFNLASISSSFVVLPNANMQKKYALCEEKYNLTRLSPFTQSAIETAFTNGKPWLNALLLYLKNNIDFAEEYLAKYAPKIIISPTQGTYLLWLNMQAYPLRGMALIRFLATHAQIGVVNGRLFGPTGDGFIRMNIALPKAHLEKALSQFCNALNEMPS